MVKYTLKLINILNVRMKGLCIFYSDNAVNGTFSGDFFPPLYNLLVTIRKTTDKNLTFKTIFYLFTLNTTNSFKS